MPLDIQKMFSDFIPDTAKQDQERGDVFADGVGQLGSAAARLGPARSRQLSRGVGGAFGLDMRTPAEKLKESLGGIDVNTPEGQDEAVQLISKVNGPAGIQTRVAFQEQARAQQAADAQTTNAGANVATSTAQLLNAQTNANKPVSAPSVWDAVDGRLYNNQTGAWKEGNGGPVTTQVEFSTLDPDLYAPRSFARFQRAVRQAEGDPIKVEDAWAQLLPKAEDGWKWKKIPEEFLVEGERQFEKMPDGTNGVTIRKEIDAANRAGTTQREQSAHIADLMTTMIDSVETGKVATGMKGIIFAVAPATGNYAFKGDLDTVLANLGLGALTEARNNSANGASGFGQLTERELTLLQQLENDLKVGLDKETLLKRLEHVKSTFESAQDRAKSDWTTRQWIGYEAPPEPEAPAPASIATPSGNTFTITPRQP